MTNRMRRLSQVALAAGTVLACLFLSDAMSPSDPGTLITQAEARIGRPLTPLSGAGVARRTTRRAVVGGAVVGGAAAATYGYGGHAACHRVIGPHGRAVTVCR
jgi:hypothetical protein